MCEASAYLKKGESAELIMESVDTIQPEENGLSLINIFGEQKFLKARIHSVSLVEHKVFLEPAE